MGSQRKEPNERPPVKKGGFMKNSDGMSSHSRSMRGNLTSKNTKQPRNNT